MAIDEVCGGSKMGVLNEGFDLLLFMRSTIGLRPRSPYGELTRKPSKEIFDGFSYLIEHCLIEHPHLLNESSRIDDPYL